MTLSNWSASNVPSTLSSIADYCYVASVFCHDCIMIKQATESRGNVITETLWCSNHYPSRSRLYRDLGRAFLVAFWSVQEFGTVHWFVDKLRYTFQHGWNSVWSYIQIRWQFFEYTKLCRFRENLNQTNQMNRNSSELLGLRGGVLCLDSYQKLCCWSHVADHLSSFTTSSFCDI